MMHRASFPTLPRVGAIHALLFGALLLTACGSSSSGTAYGREGPLGPPADGAVFVVSNTAGFPVVGARVYLIPYLAVNGAPISGPQVLSGSAADRDEPLEDAITAGGAGFPQAMTDAGGSATFTGIPDDTYFLFVMPAGADTEHLPGGNRSRLAVAATTFVGTTQRIVLSSRPAAGSTYQGSSVCLSCHSAYATTAKHAHRLGFAVPGQFSALQDPTQYPDYQDGWNRFLPAATHTGGTAVWFYDYDPLRGSDKFRTSLSNPGAPHVIFAKAWLWRDTGDQKYKITLENVINGGDAMSPWTMEVSLTYGGALNRQNYLVAVPGRNGHYPLLQYQTQGNESWYDRTRKVYRDYHLDWFWDANTTSFKLPPTNSAFEGNCTSCHFTGFARTQDGGTGEWLARAIRDVNGVIDIDGDGKKDEINIGCESCHGPGSTHINWVLNLAPAGREARYIVTPQNLNASRAVMICGRCHDRVVGKGSNPNDEPLSTQNRMLLPGAGRAEYLSAHTNQPGPSLSDLWPDEFHSRGSRQQYTDFFRSAMHRNSRVLTTCMDCHDSHGDSTYPHQMIYDQDDPQSLLCLNCHLIPDLGAHTQVKVGFDHGFLPIGCIDCHQVKTAQGGAGQMGKTRGAPTGMDTDVFLVYWANDTTSHLFTVPRRTNPGVDHVAPGSAMPIPFTNACASCHNVFDLYPKPGVPPLRLDPVPADDE